MHKKNHIYLVEVLVWVSLLAILIFLGFNRHSKDSYDDYHSVIWSDAAGYYVYLPLWFSSDFDQMSLDELSRVEESTGQGFEITQSKKVLTKYTYGTSLLQLPFYLITKIVFPRVNSFSKEFHWAIIIASCSYGWLGLLFLYKTMRKMGGRGYVISLALILLSTNLYYYVVDSGGMSHVYSFFCFSVLMYVLSNISEHKLYWYLVVFISGLIVLIRPVNLLFLPFLYAIQISLNERGLQELIRLNSLKVFGGLGIALILIIPQMYYWYDVHGSLLTYTYGDESFSNLLSPKVIEVLFSSNNGLILYNPSWLLLLGIPIYRTVSQFSSERTIEIISLLLFIAVTYVISSWWIWNFGCGFGHRSYVEFLAPFALVFFHGYRKLSRTSQGYIWALALVFILWNLKLVYSYDECWLGGIWEYEKFMQVLFGPTR